MYIKSSNYQNSEMPIKVGEFTFYPARNVLNKQGEIYKIEPKVCQLLLLLCESKGHVVNRQTLTEALWAGRVVSDDALRSVVRKLREVLSDDAKQPSYLKTFPQKGYQLIADVDIGKPQQTPSITWKQSLLALSLVLLLCIFVLKFWFFNSQPTTQVEQLTMLTGSEVIADYNEVSKNLVFSHRANKNDYLQLYAKNLTTNKTSRLVWEDANFGNAYWSPNGRQLVYVRSTPTIYQTFIADYQPEQGLTNVTELAINQKKPLSWSHDGQYLYLCDSWSAPPKGQIWRYSLTTQEFSRVTSPNTATMGDFAVKESHDGSMLAILRQHNNKRTELIVMHLDTGELVNVQSFLVPVTRMVWAADNQTITLSSFDGDLLEYSLHSRELTTLTLNESHINDVFYQCGKQCLYMRQHNGNYLDLAEQPSPFNNETIVRSQYYEMPDAEDMPVIGQSTGSLYYIANPPNQMQINVIEINKATKTLVSLSPDTEIESMSINQDESYLTGLANGRVFLVNLVNNSFEYLTTELEMSFAPRWSALKNHIEFAKQEHDQVVLYRYSIDAQSFIRIDTNAYVIAPIDAARTLHLDADKNLSIKYIDGTSLALGKLPEVSPNRWQLTDSWLYYTSHEENMAMLTRVNLKTGELQSQELAKNRWKLNFSLSQDESRMVIVRSLLAQSNLVKVTF
ncbi:winged helix-turn-helix domain-containing protein [uncultured Paraglaciecola sp.]|uniref:winged helix-turn-helix domain-containing protein n=1 Tax=uncultured Paraglaciecola sp. TaxID=1765024 RepID=UPI0025967C7C|nr:winged helix-turn-helix domain-containing protein [uncultured Paraglaciecola sp.]